MDRLAATRRHFAEELQRRFSLQSNRLVEAFASVPREHFVGDGPWFVSHGEPNRKLPDVDPYRQTPDADPAHLYADVRVALDASRELNNGAPSNHAIWIDRLGVRAGDHVVHIGAGTGYYTAILAAIVGESGAVTAFEVDPGLLGKLRRNTSALPQVKVVEARGIDVPFEEADRIYVNCALTRPPAHWLMRLRDGGAMLMPLTEHGPKRHGGVFCMQRQRDAWSAEYLGAIRMFPCEGGREPGDEKAIAEAFERGGAEGVRSLRTDAHASAEECWLHAESFCLSTRGTA